MRHAPYLVSILHTPHAIDPPYAVRPHATPLAFVSQFVDKKLMERLNTLVDEEFARVTYTEAVELLQAEIAKDPSKWEFPEVEFGTDLATEHERWLAEEHFGKARALPPDHPPCLPATLATTLTLS